MSGGEESAIKIRLAPDREARRVIAVTGSPGTGKTTLVEGLSHHYGYQILSSGDVARVVDPAGLEVGAMADEAAFRAGWAEAVRRTPAGAGVVLYDGIPRSEQQLALIPHPATIFLLTCRPDIAISRLVRRGREDDGLVIVARRVREQSALLEVPNAGGWAFQAAGIHRCINTSTKTPAAILHDVIEYLDGRKADAF